MKITPTKWLVADFESMNVHLESKNDVDSMEKFFVSNPVAIGHIIVKKT